jgi:hypothetical protein
LSAQESKMMKAQRFPRPLPLGAFIFSTAVASACLAAATDPRTTDKGVAYVLGGVTESELATIASVRPKFNLAVYTRSDLSGAALCDAQIHITDASGQTVLNVPMDGPWLLSTLPPGKYNLTATFQNEAQQRSFDISPKGNSEVRLSFRSDPQVSLYPVPK